MTVNIAFTINSVDLFELPVRVHGQQAIGIRDVRLPQGDRDIADGRPNVEQGLPKLSNIV
jgi:hypothetical protein